MILQREYFVSVPVLVVQSRLSFFFFLIRNKVQIVLIELD